MELLNERYQLKLESLSPYIVTAIRICYAIPASVRRNQNIC